MSCTENESGPFVVFFLPAVVGCLTILLARRWANSQVNNASSTAVSRRRKIIKDPLIKRPLPNIACKMLSHASKKSLAGKKGNHTSVADEDFVSSGKRSGRAARFSPGTSIPTEKCVEGPLPPKHIPFPHIPQDGEFLFETMTFVFTSVAAGLQFLNLYRTVWWLPHSHTNQAMNFYLIDPHIVAFIMIILARRLLLSATKALLCALVAPKMLEHAAAAARMFILGLVLGALTWCTYFISIKYPFVKIFYLCYPAIIYFVLFGVQAGPFLELGNEGTPPLHCCTHSPQNVREEINALKTDFNLRVKKILFGSVLGAYYSSFIPCCFTQSYLYYDIYAATQQLALVWGGLFTRYAAQLLNSQYCDVLHRSALHLGTWEEEKKTHGEGALSWCGDQLWARGTRVFAGGTIYLSQSPATAAMPTCSTHRRFYAVFRNPSMLICILLCMQLSLILLQLCLLFSSVHWHHFLSLTVLLFTNYYTLFKLVRDYLVAWKVYKAEYMIQDKSLIGT